MTKKITPAIIRFRRASARDPRGRAAGYVAWDIAGAGAVARDESTNRSGGGPVTGDEAGDKEGSAGVVVGGSTNRNGGGLAGGVGSDAADVLVGEGGGGSSIVFQAGDVRAPQDAHVATPWWSYESEVPRHLPHRVTVPGRQAPSATARHRLERT